MKWLAISLGNYGSFAVIAIGIVGLLASIYYRGVVRKVKENDSISFKVGWYWIWMFFGFFISIMFIVIGVMSLFV